MINKTKKNKIDITEQSMKDLMQETYVDIVDEKNKAVAAYKKFSKEIEGNTDIAMVGKVTNELLKIIDGTIEKKLRLIKIQSDIIYKNAKNNEPNERSIVITEDDKKWAEEFLKNGGDNLNEKEYGD